MQDDKNPPGMDVDENDLQEKIDELFVIWGDPTLLKQHGLISGFLLNLRPGKGIEVTLAPWQKKMVYFIHSILYALEDIPGFDSLKHKISKGNRGGGHDAHLLAAYVYHSMIGLKDIESISEKPFDTDFSFLKGKCEHFVQVKDLRINGATHFWNHALISCRIRIALERLGVKTYVSLEGIVPEAMLDPKFDWYEFLRLKDLSQPIIIPSTDGNPPFCIKIVSDSNGLVGSGIYSLKFLPNRILEVAERVQPHDPSTKKYLCLVFVPNEMVEIISKSSSQIFELWKATNLDGVVFMEFQELSEVGCRFDILEQYKDKNTFLLNRRQFSEAW